MGKNVDLANDMIDLKVAARLRRTAMTLDKDKAMRRVNVEAHKRVIGEIRASRRHRRILAELGDE